MRHLPLTIIAILIAFPFTEHRAQTSRKQCQQRELDASKNAGSMSSVHIAFQRTGEGMPIFDDDSRERVWLVLVNNSKFSIYVHKFVFGKDEQVALYYEVERENGALSKTVIPQGYRPSDSRSPESELKSGETITFSVPRNHLIDGLKIKITFYRDFDDQKLTTTELDQEKDQYVYFGSAELKTFLSRDGNCEGSLQKECRDGGADSSLRGRSR